MAVGDRSLQNINNAEIVSVYHHPREIQKKHPHMIAEVDFSFNNSSQKERVGFYLAPDFQLKEKIDDKTLTEIIKLNNKQNMPKKEAFVLINEMLGHAIEMSNQKKTALLQKTNNHANGNSNGSTTSQKPSAKRSAAPARNSLRAQSNKQTPAKASLEKLQNLQGIFETIKEPSNELKKVMTSLELKYGILSGMALGKNHGVENGVLDAINKEIDCAGGLIQRNTTDNCTAANDLLPFTQLNFRL